MNITTEILRKAVIVTMKNGNSPRSVTKMSRPTVLGVSVIADETHDSHTETLADPHQRAATQPPAVRHDVERLVERAGERHQRAWRQPLDLTKRKLDAAEFEDKPHRQVVEVRIVQARGAGELGRIVHAPLPGRTTAAYGARRDHDACRGQLDREDEKLADDGYRRIVWPTFYVGEHNIVERQPRDVTGSECRGSRAQAEREGQIDDALFGVGT